jgi:peptide/nickel transport system permease protein
MMTDDETVKRFSTSRKQSFLNWAIQSIRVIFKDSLGATGLILVTFFILMAVLAPVVAPYGPFDVVYRPDKTVARLVSPNLTNLLGTTNQGMDVFSQLLHGSRIALLVGILSAIGSALIGTLVGLFSGYYGGWVDQVLMRLTDIAFGIPFLPFAMLAISLSRPNLYLVILLIVLFLWRTTARVIRSQVLTLKERPFIWAARAAGVSDLRILFIHIGPNVLPFSFLYMAIGISYGVMTEASLSFLGFGDPHVLSWGQMLNFSFNAGAMRHAWWWVLPPGLCLSFFVTSAFMITRAYEEMINPRLREF